MKFIRIFLLVLIIIGIGLLFTQDRWVPKLVDILIARDHIPPPFVLERPAASSTVSFNEHRETIVGNQHSFSIAYPKGWVTRTAPGSGSWDFQSTAFSENLHGVGIPPMENMWVVVAEGICNKPSADFVHEGPRPDLLYKTICKDGFQISLGLWRDDAQVKEHKLVLETIAESFHVLENKPLPYGEVTLKIGETARFADLSLTLVRVFDDSRCPEGVTCIWAGTVKAEAQIVSGMGKSTTTVELGKSVTTEAEEITLLSAAPYPKQGKTISSGDYRVTFRVGKRP